MTGVKTEKRPDASISSAPRFSFNSIANRHERLEAMLACAGAKMDALGENWSGYAQMQSRHPFLSPTNVCLVTEQYPEATALGTFRTWQAVQRTPVTQGISLLAPVLRRQWGRGKQSEVIAVRFRPVTVFDYSMTSGEPRPTATLAPNGAARPAFVADLTAVASSFGHSVEIGGEPVRPGVLRLDGEPNDAGSMRTFARSVGVLAGAGAGADLFAYVLCTANGVVAPLPPLPADPRVAALEARKALRTTFARVAFSGIARL